MCEALRVKPHSSAKLSHKQNGQNQNRKRDERQRQPSPPDGRDRDRRNIDLRPGDRKGQIVPETFAFHRFPGAVLPGVDSGVFDAAVSRCVALPVNAGETVGDEEIF